MEAACWRSTREWPPWPGCQAGDPSPRGKPLGFVGEGPLAERDLEPHLHLRVTRDGNAVDPTLLWQ